MKYIKVNDLFDKGDKEALEKEIKRTQKDNTPMKDLSRVIVETDEENPRVLAVITNNMIEQASRILVREKPVYDQK